jgi:hypothetical protein
LGERVQQRELVKIVDYDPSQACGQSLMQLIDGLIVPMKVNPAGRESSAQRYEEFAPRNDVQVEPFLFENLRYGRAKVGLGSISHLTAAMVRPP